MLVFFHSLKSRLLFLIFIITLPGLFAIFFQAAAERQHTTEVSLDKANTAVEFISAEQVDLIDQTEHFLKQLSKDSILLTPESPACSNFLARVNRLTESYINLGAPNLNGQLQCNASPLSEPVNVADRHYIKQAIQNRDFSIGKFQFDRAAQTSSINFAYPIINPDNQQLVGLTVAVVSLDWWSERLKKASLPKKSITYILDSENKIIAVYPEDKKKLGLPISKISTLQPSGIDKQTQIMKDNQGHLKIFVNRALSTSNGDRLGTLIIGIAFDEELAAINSRYSQTALFFILFILVIVLFSIWSINRSILIPIQQLKKSTKQLQLGKHVDHQTLGGISELIELQTNFYAMAKVRLDTEEQFKFSQKKLQESENSLSRHIKNTPLGTLSWDINFICTEWNKAAEKIFGYSDSEAIGNNITELIVPLADKNKFISHYHLLLTHQGGAHFESNHITKHGHIIICNWYNTLMSDSRGLTNSIAALVQDITEERSNQETLDSFFKLPTNLHFIANFEGKLMRINEAWQPLFGYQNNELLGRDLLGFIHPDDVKATSAEIINLSKGQDTLYFENRCLTKAGNYLLISWSATASQDQKTIFAVGRDITESKRVESELKLAAGVFTHAKEAIIITDAKNNIIDVNNTFIQLSGYSKKEAIGQKTSLFKSGRQSAKFYNEMWQAIEHKGHWTGEVWNKRKNGEVYPQLVTISAIRNSEQKVQNYIALYTDITEIKAHQKQLQHIAHYDPLTGLPNRTLLADRLIQAMPQCKRNKQSLAVAFLDLDGFKTINDKYGHTVGDNLLIEMSRRIESVLREGDTLSRFGGDEFIAILVGLEKPQFCEAILDNLLQAVSAPIAINNTTLNLSASIGVTIYPHDGVDAEQLLRHADQAMYTAKQEGKNRYHLFNMAESMALKHHHNRLSRIREALKNDEFILYYQPKVNMKTGELIGVEALIRWQHPKKGLLSPIEFLPMIEGHELSINIGEWVIDTALEQINAWQQIGLNLTISVNIDALQLQQDCFVQRLSQLLAAHPEVPANALALEVLETSELADIEEVSKIMHDCIKLGVSFALDDFGTGYCSLTYLKQLPVNLIKIDQSFIRDMLDDADDLSIVIGVIGLAKAFQRDVIAEGVETLEHGNLLLQLGCELAQGYGIAKPMPAKQLPNWAEQWATDKPWAKLQNNCVN